MGERRRGQKCEAPSMLDLDGVAVIENDHCQQPDNKRPG